MNKLNWIQTLELKPLDVEGGWYREIYRSPLTSQGNNLGAAIYYFLGKDDFSAIHKLDVDELYFFLDGDPVEIFYGIKDELKTMVLGTNLQNGEQRFIQIPSGYWQGSRLKNFTKGALLATVTFPAFSFQGFELGKFEFLKQLFKSQHNLIRELSKD